MALHVLPFPLDHKCLNRLLQILTPLHQSLGSYVIFRVLQYMKIKEMISNESQSNLDFEKFMKHVGFFQRQY